MTMSMTVKSKTGMTSSSMARSVAVASVVAIIFVVASSPSSNTNSSWSWGIIMFAEAISSSDNGVGSFNASHRGSVDKNNDDDDDNDSNAPFLVMSEILLADASNGGHADAGYAANNGGNDDIISAQASTTAENVEGVTSSSTSSSASSSEAVDATVGENENASVAGVGGVAGAERGIKMSSSTAEGSSGGGGGSDTEEEEEGCIDEPGAGGTEVVNSTLPPSASTTSSSFHQSPPSAIASFTKSTKTISVDDSTILPPSNSQPLRTLKRLQAMLDDTDYATTTTADKLWTSKDRAKYRRTRRTEQHQQRQHRNRDHDEYEGQNSDARKLRHLERQRIIRDEKERRKEMALLEQQQRRRQQQQQQQQQQQIQQQPLQQQSHYDDTAASDFTDDDTDDTDGYYSGGRGGSGGFELPNLPVYLSDGETDEETEGNDLSPPSPPPPPPYSSKYVNIPSINAHQQQLQQKQGFYRGMQPIMHPPTQGLIVQDNREMGQHYYIPPGHQHVQNEGQQSPTQYTPNNNAPLQNYRQQYPPYLQQQPNQALSPTSQQYQYDHNPHHQQTAMQVSHQQQYAAWAQAASAAAAAAAANGYYYPLPPTPPRPSSQTPYQGTQQQTVSEEQHQFSQSQQSHPQSSSYTHQYPHTLSRTHQRQAASHVAAQHLQHLYQAQQQYAGGPSGVPLRPGEMLYPQPPPPPLQTSQESNNVYQRHDSTSEESSTSWPMPQPQQLQQYYNSQMYDEGEWVRGEGERDNTLPNIATERRETSLSPDLSASETIDGSTMVTPSSTSTKMGVKSAFLSPPPPSTRIPSGMSGNGIRTGASTVTELVESSINVEGFQFDDDNEILIAGAGTNITFDSIHKLIFATISIALLSYCAVSPRSVPFPEYNRLFLQNLSIVGLGTAIAPIVLFLGAFDGRYNNINTAIGTFHVSFTLGYALAFVSEIIVTTAVRLGVFRIWEPQIFSLTPKVPSIILPWVLRETHYKPKRITLFAADFGASCVASPIIEEYLKLRLVQWTCKLPRNFKLIKKIHKSRRKRKKQYSLQPVRSDDALQVTNINCYVTQMLAASLGLKLFDATRRILMYTKESDENKLTYAICRGTFPIHELCGTMTALLLARRDVLGIKLPIWKILGPAVFLHGMANFRGMKPIFKWNSSTPWSEMQLNQLRRGGDPTWKQLLPKTYAKLVWLTILCRVFGYCMKNYYLIGRQATKRTTTYSGKLHAFNAKLQTDAMLKRAKND